MGNFPDRLVSELRLAKAKTLEQAQAVLDLHLLEQNRKFSRPAQAEPPGESQRRTDRPGLWPTITFNGVIFQIPKNYPHRFYAHKRIDAVCALDGSVEFFYKKEKIAAF